MDNQHNFNLSFIVFCLLFILFVNFLFVMMNSVPQIGLSMRKLSVDDCFAKSIEKNNFITPTSCRHMSIVKLAPRKYNKLARKRLSFSPNINAFRMQSPDCSPILGEKCELNLSISPRADFSPRAINRILKEADNSFQNLSFLNKTISMEGLLKRKKMEKYVEIFRKEEIDNLAVFSSLTERDLVEIGINNKNDRMIILEIVAEFPTET